MRAGQVLYGCGNGVARAGATPNINLADQRVPFFTSWFPGARQVDSFGTTVAYPNRAVMKSAHLKTIIGWEMGRGFALAFSRVTGAVLGFHALPRMRTTGVCPNIAPADIQTVTNAQSAIPANKNCNAVGSWADICFKQTAASVSTFAPLLDSTSTPFVESYQT